MKFFLACAAAAAAVRMNTPMSHSTHAMKALQTEDGPGGRNGNMRAIETSALASNGSWVEVAASSGAGAKNGSWIEIY